MQLENPDQNHFFNNRMITPVVLFHVLCSHTQSGASLAKKSMDFKLLKNTSLSKILWVLVYVRFFNPHQHKHTYEIEPNEFTTAVSFVKRVYFCRTSSRLFGFGYALVNGRGATGSSSVTVSSQFTSWQHFLNQITNIFVCSFCFDFPDATFIFFVFWECDLVSLVSTLCDRCLPFGIFIEMQRSQFQSENKMNKNNNS